MTGFEVLATLYRRGGLGVTTLDAGGEVALRSVIQPDGDVFTTARRGAAEADIQRHGEALRAALLQLRDARRTALGTAALVIGGAVTVGGISGLDGGESWMTWVSGALPAGGGAIAIRAWLRWRKRRTWGSPRDEEPGEA